MSFGISVFSYKKLFCIDRTTRVVYLHYRSNLTAKISNLRVPRHYLILNIFAHTHHMLSNLKKSGNVVSLKTKHILMANSKVQLRFFLPHNIQVVLNLTRPNEHCRQFIVSLDLHVLILMTYARHHVHC